MTVAVAFWAGMYIGAGFLFAAELDIIARYTSMFAATLMLVLGAPLLFFLRQARR
jgi:hypothetical protein